MRTNKEFELRGVNHVALVCKDMAKTVDFYVNTLGMPLTKTLAIPGGAQHFFFDIGNGDHLAFFWFPKAPAASPGISNPAALPGGGDLSTAHASMNHLAFDVPLEKFESYRDRLIDKGVEVSSVFDHDDSESTVAKAFHPGVFVRSIYFRDPDGVLLEFASWTRDMGQEGDVGVDPFDASGNPVSLRQLIG